jgi:hypothetical protein
LTIIKDKKLQKTKIILAEFTLTLNIRKLYLKTVVVKSTRYNIRLCHSGIFYWVLKRGFCSTVYVYNNYLKYVSCVETNKAI